jgi:hypothetical protein
MADGILPLLSHPERSVLVAILYPLRGAEALAMVVIMASAVWGLTVLVPEYCLGVWADANTLGTPSMGMLVILISAIPGLLLFPLVLIYLLQYLGRILVSSAQGAMVPPRTPDRNFDGFTTGLSPWLAWLLLGLSVSLCPFVLLWTFGDLTGSGRTLLLVGLIGFGFPYAEVALMMSFLHDRPLAATPLGVINALMRHGGCLTPTLLKLSLLSGLTVVPLALTFALRASYFWGYLVMALACWMMMIWSAMVTMRVLGLCYFHHKKSLRWHRHQPRWGVSWRL